MKAAGDVQWWLPIYAYRVEVAAVSGGVVLLVLLARRLRRRGAARTWLLGSGAVVVFVVGALLVNAATQPWVEGFTPPALLSVVPAHLALTLTVSLCVAQAFIWASFSSVDVAARVSARAESRG